MTMQHDTPFARAQSAVKALGLKLTSTRHGLCVNYIGGREATAYYCDDVAEALAVADRMRKFATRRL